MEQENKRIRASHPKSDRAVDYSSSLKYNFCLIEYVGQSKSKLNAGTYGILNINKLLVL